MKNNTIDLLKNYINEFYKKHNKKPSIQILKMILKTKGLIVSDSALKNILNENIEKEEVKEEIKEKRKEKKETNLLKCTFSFILLVIGVVCTCVSIYYSCFWLLQYNESAILSLSLAASMVIFAAVLPAIRIYFKNKQGIKSYVMMCVVIFLSILSTIAGQYNLRIQKENKIVKENVSINNNTVLYNQLLKEETDYKKELDRKRKEATIYEEMLNKFKTPEDREKYKFEWWDANRKMIAVNEEIKSIVNKIDNVQHDIKNMLKKENLVNITKGTEIEAGSFYEFLSQILPINARMIEFSMSMIFAIIVDFLAPLCIYMGIFLLRKNEVTE